MYLRVTCEGSADLCNSAHPPHTYIYAICLYIFVYVANGQLHKKFLAEIAKWPRATGHKPEARGSLQRVQPFGLSLMKLIPTSPFLYACYFCVCAAHKNFWPIFLRLHLPVASDCRRSRGGGAEREGGRRIGSTKSNKSPSHDNATFTTAHLSPSCSNLFRLYLCTRIRIRTVQQHCDSRLDPTRS